MSVNVERHVTSAVSVTKRKERREKGKEERRRKRRRRRRKGKSDKRKVTREKIECREARD